MKQRAKDSKPGPKGKGLFRIVEFTNASGTTAYRVTGWTLNGKRVRTNFAEQADAIQELQRLEFETANLKDAARAVVTRLTPEQAAEAEAAYAALEGKPLLPAIRWYLENYREPVTKIAVATAFDEFIKEKQKANKRPLTIRNLELKCRELKLLHGTKNVSDIGAPVMRDLIFKPERGPVARDNYRRALNGFFAWAKSKGYCESNPVDSIERIEADESDPQALSIEEAQNLMNAAASYKDGKLVPFVALALFAGMRPDQELKRITWDDINCDSETITVSGKVAKMRSKRVIEAVCLVDKQGKKETKRPSNLFQWLRPHANKDPKTPIKGANWRRDFDAVKLLAGFGTPEEGEDKPKLKPWVQDYMRHTAISYHFAWCQHEGKTAMWAGNSPDIVHRKYKDLVKPENVRKFWSIAPTAAENIITLKTAAA
jgi:integrase